MGKEIITFSDIETEKQNSHSYQNSTSLYYVNIVIVFNKVSFGKKGFKYFIGYKNDYEKVMPLCIVLPKISAYRK